MSDDCENLTVMLPSAAKQEFKQLCERLGFSQSYILRFLIQSILEHKINIRAELLLETNKPELTAV